MLYGQAGALALDSRLMNQGVEMIEFNAVSSTSVEIAKAQRSEGLSVV